MRRRIKEFVEVEDHRSLAALIEQLVAIQNHLPEGSDAQVRMRGDDVFGRRLTVAYWRDDAGAGELASPGGDLRAAA